MRQQWAIVILTGAAICAAALTFGTSLQANTANNRANSSVAVVDVGFVFGEYQRQKDLIEEVGALQQQLEAENDTRKGAIDTLGAELDSLDPEDPTYVVRTRDMLKMQIEYKNWVDLKQADMAREVGVWSTTIYQDIRTATAKVAERDGWDLVLYKGEFERHSLDPEVIKNQIRSIQVLYASSGVDITQIVLDTLDNDYKSKPRKAMLDVP